MWGICLSVISPIFCQSCRSIRAVMYLCMLPLVGRLCWGIASLASLVRRHLCHMDEHRSKLNETLSRSSWRHFYWRSSVQHQNLFRLWNRLSLVITPNYEIENACWYFRLLWAATVVVTYWQHTSAHDHCPACGAFDLGLAVSVPLPIVTGIFVLLWFQSRLT